MGPFVGARDRGARRLLRDRKRWAARGSSSEARAPPRPPGPLRTRNGARPAAARRGLVLPPAPRSERPRRRRVHRALCWRAIGRAPVFQCSAVCPARGRPEGWPGRLRPRRRGANWELCKRGASSELLAPRAPASPAAARASKLAQYSACRGRAPAVWEFAEGSRRRRPDLRARRAAERKGGARSPRAPRRPRARLGGQGPGAAAGAGRPAVHWGPAAKPARRAAGGAAGRAKAPRAARRGRPCVKRNMAHIIGACTCVGRCARATGVSSRAVGARSAAALIVWGLARGGGLGGWLGPARPGRVCCAALGGRAAPSQPPRPQAACNRERGGGREACCLPDVAGRGAAPRWQPWWVQWRSGGVPRALAQPLVRSARARSKRAAGAVHWRPWPAPSAGGERGRCVCRRESCGRRRRRCLNVSATQTDAANAQKSEPIRDCNQRGREHSRRRAAGGASQFMRRDAVASARAWAPVAQAERQPRGPWRGAALPRGPRGASGCCQHFISWGRSGDQTDAEAGWRAPAGRGRARGAAGRGLDSSGGDGRRAGGCQVCGSVLSASGPQVRAPAPPPPRAVPPHSCRWAIGASAQPGEPRGGARARGARGPGAVQARGAGRLGFAGRCV